MAFSNQDPLQSAMVVKNHALQNKTNIAGVAFSPGVLPESATPSKKTQLKVVVGKEGKAKPTKTTNTTSSENKKPHVPSPTTTIEPARGRKRSRAIENDETGDELALDSVFKTKRARRSKAPPSLTVPAKIPIPAIILTPAKENLQHTGGILSISAHTDTLAPVQPSQTPPFCCVSILAEIENALWNCHNETCVQRHAIILLSDELKAFNYAIPIASAKSLQEAKYMIQVIKYIPSAAAQIALLSVSRIKASPAAVKKMEWEIDTAGGASGRFFIEALNEKGIAADKLERDDSIWAEVEGVGPKNGKLYKWERMGKSEMEFKCIEHKEVKWVCVYWQAKV